MKSYLSGIAGALLLGFVSVPAAHAVVVSGSIDASTEVDYIYFSTTSADTVSIDVYAHGVLGGLDPWIYLYHDDGTLTADDLITYNDDGGDAGLLDSSTSIYDSYIETALAPGAYVIAISGYFFSRPYS